MVIFLLAVVTISADTLPAQTPAPAASPAASTAPVAPADQSTPPAATPPAATPPAATPPAAAPSADATPSTTNSPGAAAPGGATFTIQRTTRLVVLDMVVTDAQGNLIRDLKREEVHVQEAGEAQKIDNFDVAGAHMPDAQASIESTADLDRIAPRAPVNIILLDEFNTRFEDMAFARYSLKKYLDKAPGKLDAPTMLIAVSLDKFVVLRDYTQNKDEILNALEHSFTVNPWQVQQGAWVGERYATAFITLRRVAEAVIGHPGHKNMIWIGRGFPAFSFRKQPVDTETRVNNAVQDCVNRLRDARITLYTIDPAGVMVNPGEYGDGLYSYDPFGGNYEFSKLARATGGRTLYGRNDVNAEIGTAIQDAASFYTVTYRPSNGSPDPQKFRRITVTIDRPGAKVITREGYYPRANTPAKPFDPQNPSKRLVTDLLAADSSTMVYDGIPLTIKPSPSDADTYLLRIESKGLVWSPVTDTDPRRHADIIVLVSTFDKKGKELKRVAKTLRASAPANVAPTGRIDNAMQVAYKVDHDPKAVRARFVVRVIATSRMGTADADLTAQAVAAPIAAPVP